MPLETINLDELSAMFHIDRRNIAARIRRLNEEEDFPPPLPSLRGVYSRAQVLEWIHRPRTDTPTVVDYAKAARLRMDRHKRRQAKA